jgi:TonB-dependent SusC/RagA subfamily outer membrane receptor
MLLQSKLPTATVTNQGSIQVFLSGVDHDNFMGSSENAGAALLVLDGREVPNIDNLNPAEVKSITVLKGPGAAIYGSRGSNGVILIKRKSVSVRK